MEGLAAWLDEEGLADYKPAGYSATDRAVTFKRLPTQPDTAVAVAVYGVADATVVPGTQVSIQLRFRAAAGDRLSVDAWADQVADRLHWRHQFMAGTVRVQRARRTIAAMLGVDDNGREERADSYEITLA